jgi:UDP-N-acetylmuramoyl-tripeptide--D-alanyl-D-alanine ligase
MLGEHNAVNALAAIAVARHMNLNDEQIAAGLAHTEGIAMRLDVRQAGPPHQPITIINDAYNANPDSMEAALTELSRYPGSGRRVAILGDMLELGAYTPALHRQLGDRITEQRIDMLFCIGQASLYTAEAVAREWPADRVHAHAKLTDDIAHQIAQSLRDGDIVLVKASRAMELERLVTIIEQVHGAAAA